MKLRNFKCPNCNANINVNTNVTKGICDYCKSEFVIEDETIKIEHISTIEIVDNASLEIAKTTLEKFKDYDKSLKLYRQLLNKYAHKREVYIGLVRSITKDFTIEKISANQLEEINEYFKKYKILSTEEEYKSYEEKINELNEIYWYNLLITKTNNFNPNLKGEKINVIEEYYNNYSKYCKKNDNILKNKYENYIIEYKEYNDKKKNRKRKFIIITLITIILLIGLLVLFLLAEKTNKKTNSINLSDINNNILVHKNYDYFKKYFKKTFSTLNIDSIKINNEDKSIDIKVLTKNILSTKKETFNFKIIDNMGPIITPIPCNFTDTEEVDLYKCFELFDFTDGEIDNKKAIVNYNKEDLKTEGIKTIEVVATDNEGNENKLNIDIEIGKTPFKLEFNLKENLIVGKKYTPTYKIIPDNILDKTISYEYDKEYIAIEDGTIRVLKKGQTEICAISNYNKAIKQCKKLNLELECKDSYTFKLNANKEVTLTSGEVFCTGTYKIYAEVTNKNEFYTIKIKPKDSQTWKSMTIYKDSSFLNDEGNKYVLGEGDQIITDIGITSIKLIKTK